MSWNNTLQRSVTVPAAVPLCAVCAWLIGPQGSRARAVESRYSAE